MSAILTRWNKFRRSAISIYTLFILLILIVIGMLAGIMWWTCDRVVTDTHIEARVLSNGNPMGLVFTDKYGREYGVNVEMLPNEYARYQNSTTIPMRIKVTPIQCDVYLEDRRAAQLNPSYLKLPNEK